MKGRNISQKLGPDDSVEHLPKTFTYLTLKKHNMHFFVNRYNT